MRLPLMAWCGSASAVPAYPVIMKLCLQVCVDDEFRRVRQLFAKSCQYCDGRPCNRAQDAGDARCTPVHLAPALRVTPSCTIRRQLALCMCYACVSPGVELCLQHIVLPSQGPVHRCPCVGHASLETGSQGAVHPCDAATLVRAADTVQGVQIMQYCRGTRPQHCALTSCVRRGMAEP